jgi:uncharacterized membrane protein YqjE
MAIFDRSPLASPHARDALNRLIDGFQTLVREHLALAKVELKEDLKRMGRSVALSLAGIPALLAGYLFLNVAIALLLATIIPSWVAFGLVAIVNLAAGSALTIVFAKKAKETTISLSSTEEELRRNREMISNVANRVAPVEARPPPAAPERVPPVARPSWTPAPRAGSDAETMRPVSPARPYGKAGATVGLERRVQDPVPGQPVAGATSTPDGEPMTATRSDLAH